MMDLQAFRVPYTSSTHITTQQRESTERNERIGNPYRDLKLSEECQALGEPFTCVGQLALGEINNTYPPKQRGITRSISVLLLDGQLFFKSTACYFIRALIE